VLLFSWLPPYRVLMVWVYDRTRSLLVVMLMHFVIVFDGPLFVFGVPQGVPVAAYDVLLGAGLWVMVAIAMRRA
jgi:membrane protease YdiL (CAAX protease family)